MEFPKGKYDIIYADPPWKYNDSQKEGGSAYFGAEARYPTMDIKEIYNLPVKEISKKNSVLFLWVVSPLLQEGIETLKNGDFNLKQLRLPGAKRAKTKKN